MAETRDPRDAQIALLEERLARLERILEAQAARIAQLEAENAELRARLNKNSQNSSKPPSSDGPQVSRPQGKPSLKPRGGQPGHKGAERVRLKPDEVVDHRPQNCRHCSRQLEGDDPDPKWFQVFELPVIKPIVTEHRGQTFPSRFGPPALVTVHPSSILRSRDAEQRHEAFARFVADLKRAHHVADGLSARR